MKERPNFGDSNEHDRGRRIVKRSIRATMKSSNKTNYRSDRRRRAGTLCGFGGRKMESTIRLVVKSLYTEFVLSVERALGRENCGERGPSITLNSCTCLFDRPFFRGIPFRSGCRCISGRKQFIWYEVETTSPSSFFIIFNNSSF